MSWQYTPFTLPLVLAALVSIATAAFVLRKAGERLYTRLVGFYLAMSVGASLWALGYAAQLSSTTLAGKLLWNDVVWTGVTLLAVAWAYFAFHYAGVDRAFKPHWMVALALVPTITLVAAWTNPIHGLVMSDPHLESTSIGIVILSFVPGPVFLLFLVTSYVVDLFTFGVLARALYRSRGTERREFAVLLGVGVLPFVGSLASVAGLWQVAGLDLTPVLFSITSISFGWVLVRYHLFDLVPVARRTIVEELQDGVLVTDSDGRILDLNQTAAAILCREDEASPLGQSLDVVANGLDGLLAAFDDPGTEVTIETTIDGRLRIFDLRVDDVGVGYVGVLRDRTDSHQAQRRFRTLIERSDTLIFVVDSGGRIEYASPSVGSTLERDPASLVGTDVVYLVHPDEREKALRTFLTQLDDDHPRELTLRMSDADGKWRDIECISQPLLQDPDIEGIVVWGRDVTDEHQYEERLRVLNRVLRHDLRNDMNVVAGYASLLAEHDDDSVTKAAAVISRKAGELVDLGEKARMVEETLSGTEALRPVDVAAMVREQVNLLESAWPDVTVSLDMPEAAYVEAHPLISSALDNVLENAIEHNPDPTPTVAVTIRGATDGNHSYVDVVVTDDGPGIPQIERDVLTAGESSLAHSSGLGLWLVNWVVDQSGGELHITDTGAGSAVTIRLPALVDLPQSIELNRLSWLDA